LLAQEVVASYAGKVRFVSENFGSSALAERFGVTRYPAVFVDEVLVARPRDFGFFGKGDSPGRYTPWRDAGSQGRFKKDLARMIDLVLAGRKEDLRLERSGAPEAAQARRLPAFTVTDFAGRPLSAGDLRGRPVVIEFWATWCPPCRSTLAWLGDVKKRFGDRLAVVALAVESPEPGAREFARSASPEIRWAAADAATAGAFGDIAAVPTLFLFGADGKAAATFYGAPPDLHERVLQALAGLGLR
jgi:thiol-disulfide isomerase/thioredoxin